MKPIKQTAMLLFYLLFICRPGFGSETVLVLSVWQEFQPMAEELAEHPVTPDSIQTALLEKARLLFSAMIYGYTFTYTPSDKMRGVAEIFELSLNAEIRWGDPAMDVISSKRIDKRIYNKFSYSLSENQQIRYKAWMSNNIPMAGGRGTEHYYFGTESQMAAYENAIKEAIRSYARSRVLNKPRQIQGEVLLLNEPVFQIMAGEYQCSVKIKLIIKEIEPYSVF